LLALLRSSKNQETSSSHTANQIRTISQPKPCAEGESGSILMLTKTGDEIMWILDSGATDYICCSVELFTHQTSIAPIHVRLPNGEVVVVEYKGTVHLIDTLCKMFCSYHSSIST
jgi:hypothetical protein